MIWFVACPVTLLWFQDYNTSNKIPHPGCCVPSPVILVRLPVCRLSFLVSIVHLQWICRPPFMCAAIHAPATVRLAHHIRREHCLIFTPTAHTHTHTRALQHACFSLIVLFFLGAPVSGWHHDHGCHASRSVFSKTAEDSLAHVTTASRLTCYHGDKPANENSADSCDVDYELFVLRGDLFFFPSPLPPAQTLLLSARALRRLRT